MTDGAIIVRRAVDADAAAIGALINAAFIEYRGKLKPESGALDESAATILPQLATPGGGAIAWRIEGGAPVAVGAVLYRPDGDDLYFGRLSVPPARRGQGIAGALIRFVEDEARRRGCAGVTLGARIALAANQAMFAALGYAEVSREAHPGYDAPTSINRRKALL